LEVFADLFSFLHLIEIAQLSAFSNKIKHLETTMALKVAVNGFGRIGRNVFRAGVGSREFEVDADKEGFLRSDRSLIQTAGRTARNAAGKVIMYADTITGSMRRMMDESDRRRTKQLAYNAENGITPRTIYKSPEEIIASTAVADVRGIREPIVRSWQPLVPEQAVRSMGPEDRLALLEELREQMTNAARDLEFERAGEIRDEILKIQKIR
jgi:excinuclease ABC subunit B